MCLIISNEFPNEYTLSKAHFSYAWKRNPDGFGILYLDEMNVIKTMSESKAWNLISTGRPYIAHFRFGTSGKYGKTSLHPFPIKAKSGIHWLFHNGVVSGLGDNLKSDTSHLAHLMERAGEKYWDYLLENESGRNRFALVYPDSFVEYFGDWHDIEGSMQSNALLAPLDWKDWKAEAAEAETPGYPYLSWMGETQKIQEDFEAF